MWTTLIWTLWWAQSAPPAEAKFARVEGQLLSRDSAPLRRGRVTLQSRAGGGSLAVDTDEQGRFHFAEVPPGAYSFQATRDQYLPTTTATRGQFRLPKVVRLAAGETLRGVTFRLDRWSTASGRVRFYDGEVAVNVPVVFFRQRFFRGRRIFEVVASGRTNDRGEYRVFGLAPGSYTLAAIYDRPLQKLDVTRPMEAPTEEDSYTTTFYPGGGQLANAVPLTFQPGQEREGLDLFLEPVRTARVSGTLTNACRGGPARNAAVEVYRVGAGPDELLKAEAEVRLFGGTFVVRGLAPGNEYRVVARMEDEQCGPLRGSYSVRVTESPFDGANVLLEPPQSARLTLSRTGDPPVDPDAYAFSLEPRLPQDAIRRFAFDARTRQARVSLETGTYDLFLERAPADHYLESPLSVTGPASEEVIVRTNGAQLFGLASNEQGVALGSTITVIPDSEGLGLAHYREAYAEQNGYFLVRGLAPGAYVAVAWLDEPPCDVYNPRDRDRCRAAGKRFEVKAGERATVELTVRF